jgi:hypothetical protein
MADTFDSGDSAQVHSMVDPNLFSLGQDLEVELVDVDRMDAVTTYMPDDVSPPVIHA